MNIKIVILYILSMICIAKSDSNILSNQFNGNYCGDIFGNNLIVGLKNNSCANISANIFGIKLNCTDEKYVFKNSHIYFSDNKTDCLNKQLSEYGACPCPPHIIYNDLDKSFSILDTPIGTINLTKC